MCLCVSRHKRMLKYGNLWHNSENGSGLFFPTSHSLSVVWRLIDETINSLHLVQKVLVWEDSLHLRLFIDLRYISFLGPQLHSMYCMPHTHWDSVCGICVCMHSDLTLKWIYVCVRVLEFQCLLSINHLALSREKFRVGKHFSKGYWVIRPWWNEFRGQGHKSLFLLSSIS